MYTDSDLDYSILNTQFDNSPSNNEEIFGIKDFLQTLSQEKDQISITHRLLNFSLQCVNADYSAYIKFSNNECQLFALSEKDKFIPFDHNIDKIKRALIPFSLIEHCVKEQQQLVFNNLSSKPQLKENKYLKTKAPISIVCIPIHNRNKINGVLYLEKNHCYLPFTNKQLERLSIACSASFMAFENILTEQKKEALEQQKNREISTKALEIYHKNQVLSEIRNDLENLQNELNEEQLPLVQKLIKAVKNVVNDKQYWENFRNYFENVHPRFFDTVQKLYPQLTVEDLKYCAFIKIHMSNREIAHLLNINQESVRTHKYRIKKKIKLSKTESLQEHLNTIYSTVAHKQF